MQYAGRQERVMKHKTRNSPSPAGKTTVQTSGAPENAEKQTLKNGYVGKPLDGSQYIDVIEEQEYADRRPTPEEQKPRFSYLHNEKSQDGNV
jgi:hypothetical protein